KQIKGNKAILSCEISLKKAKKKEIFFRVDKQYPSFLVDDATPFLASFLIPALFSNEPVVIKGSVSQKMTRNIEKIVRLFEQWSIKVHTPSITFSQKTKDTFQSN